jgi:hypothetical protein
MANIVAHGACGVKWTQISNRTGHCGGCHETFSSLRAFDLHQSMKDGRSVCEKPASAGLQGRVDRNVPDLVVWGEKGSIPVPAG